LAAAKFEVGCIEERIAAAVRRWQTTGVTVRLLEVVRERYEAERQPETLSEASLYLEKLTSGKYTRIWTPLGEHELRVDDQEGRPMSLDVLSRGTREAVFLSLRLALVAAYGRRGVNIPMVLDDVLVNLDAKRSEAAVKVLCDFAKEGRQLLFFTCHDHIERMFDAVNVDVRILPAQPIIAEPIVVPEAIEVVPEPIVDAIPVSEFHDEIETVARDEYSLAEELHVSAPSPLFDLVDYLSTDPVPPVIQEEPEEAYEEVEVVYDELSDNHAFEDAPWWDRSRGSWVEEENAA
jgi:hypothetical protein